MHASDPSLVENKTRTLSRRDGLVLAIFAIAGGGWALYAYHCLMPAAIQWETYDFWFDADIPWLYRNFTERWMSPTATARHPLLMLLTLPWGYTVGIGPLLGLQAQSVRIMAVVLDPASFPDGGPDGRPLAGALAAAGIPEVRLLRFGDDWPAVLMGGRPEQQGVA